MLWLLCALAALALAHWLFQARRRAASPPWRLGALLFAGLLLGVGAFAPPWILVGKVLARLIMPASLVALGLGAVALGSLRRRRHRALTLAVLAVYLLASNEWVGAAMTRRLERDYAEIDPLAAGPLDAVLVLSGGTSVTPRGAAQLGGSGDRVALAAELYNAGVTRVLVTSGRSIDGLAYERDFSLDTAQLWQRMGVPAAAIVRVPLGRNTTEEAAAYAALVRERGFTRVGLVTSGSHMRRALRLMRRAGLTVTPLPADLKGAPAPLSPVSLIPQAHALCTVETATWELVGALVGR